MSDPAEWLHAVLLLFTGLIVGELAALQRQRVDDARQREREAVALFRASHALATREMVVAVLPRLAGILRDNAGMDRVWLSLGPGGREQAAAGTDPDVTTAVDAARAAGGGGPVPAVVARHTEGPLLGFLGEPRINVLELDLGLGGLLRPSAGASGSAG